MFISNMYKYEKDGVIYVAGEVPEGGEILETMEILNAKEGFDLIRISDNENVGANIWLRDGDVKKNYKEVERKNEGSIN